MAANLVTQPLETIKTRQMLHGGSSWATGVALVRADGPRALYKGINPALLRAVISGGGRLCGFTALKSVAIDRGVLQREPQPVELPIRGAMAVCAASSAALLSAPVDLLRTRQAASVGETPSMLRLMGRVCKKEGPLALFSGGSALMGRAAAFNLGQLLTYDECKWTVVRRTDFSESSPVTHVLAACGAGLAATTASAPFENVKTHMQMHPTGTGPVGTMISMVRNAGVTSLFRGWTPLYLKVAPHTLCVFVCLEQLRELFGVEAL